MYSQQAIRILMMSPIYFRMDLPARKTLVEEFCSLYDDIMSPKFFPLLLVSDTAKYGSQTGLSGEAAAISRLPLPK